MMNGLTEDRLTTVLDRESRMSHINLVGSAALIRSHILPLYTVDPLALNTFSTLIRAAYGGPDVFDAASEDLINHRVTRGRLDQLNLEAFIDDPHNNWRYFYGSDVTVELTFDGINGRPGVSHRWLTVTRATDEQDDDILVRAARTFDNNEIVGVFVGESVWTSRRSFKYMDPGLDPGIEKSDHSVLVRDHRARLTWRDAHGCKLFMAVSFIRTRGANENVIVDEYGIVSATRNIAIGEELIMETTGTFS